MMFSADKPIPFTVGDLKKHLSYMNNESLIKLAGTNSFLGLVGHSNDVTVFSFNKEDYFAGWDFLINSEIKHKGDD